jgi:hypothetical protein
LSSVPSSQVVRLTELWPVLAVGQQVLSERVPQTWAQLAVWVPLLALPLVVVSKREPA